MGTLPWKNFRVHGKTGTTDWQTQTATINLLGHLAELVPTDV